MGTVVDSLSVALDYVFNDKNAKRFNKSVKQSTKFIKSATRATIGFATVLGGLGGVTINATDKFIKMGKALGTSTENLIALSRASELLSGDKTTAQSMLQTFEGISNGLKAGVAPSQEFLRGLDAVGVSLEQFQALAPEKRLLAISKGFQSLGEDSQDVATHLFGFDLAARNLVEGLNDANFKEALDGVGDIDEKQIEKTQREIIKLKQKAQQTALEITDAVIPKLNEMFDKIKDLVPEITLALTDSFETIDNWIKKIKQSWLDFKSIFTIDQEDEGVFSNTKKTLLNMLGLGDEGKVPVTDEQAFLNSSTSPAAALAQNSQVNNSGGNRNLTQHNDIKISVNGSGDPASTSESIFNRFTDSLGQVGRNFLAEDIG